MKRKLMYLFVNPYANETTRGSVETETVIMYTAAVKDYEDACRVAKEYAEQGVSMIELCGGFGTIGVAKVKEAVGDAALVGVVRFDTHPGFDGESGDTRF